MESKRKDMDVVKEIKEILALQDSGGKDSRLSVLSGEFEYGDRLDKADVVEGTRLLLDAALQEEDKALKKEFFNLNLH